MDAMPPPYPFRRYLPCRRGLPPDSADGTIARDHRLAHGQSPVVEDAASLRKTTVAGRTAGVCSPGFADGTIARDHRIAHGRGPADVEAASLRETAVAGRTAALRGVAAAAAESLVAADGAFGQRQCRTVKGEDSSGGGGVPVRAGGAGTARASLPTTLTFDRLSEPLSWAIPRPSAKIS